MFFTDSGDDIMVSDRISPLSILLDDIFYKSTITDLRNSFFRYTYTEEGWLLFSDYYLGNDKPNKVITFSAMPYCPDLIQLQNLIKMHAPKDIKNTRTVSTDFIKIINSLPIVNFIFIFDNKKYFIWDRPSEAKEAIHEYAQVLHEYIAYWHRTEPATSHRLKKISNSLREMEKLLAHNKKTQIVSGMYLISILGGYVGALLQRETSLKSLAWLSDRDSTNELCNNLIRDLFQINLIDITKENIRFSFTTANSDSHEWYEDMTRIPDYLTGAVSGFDFAANTPRDQKTAKLLALHFNRNIRNTYLYKFEVGPEHLHLRRMLIDYNPTN